MPRAGELSVAGKRCLEVLQSMPGVPSRTLARMLVKKEPKLFKSVETARDMIRAFRGQRGKQLRKRHNYGLRRPPGSVTDGNLNLPDPVREIDPWHVVKVDFKRALLLYDVHIPYHDQTSCRVAFSYGRKFNPDCIVLGGDFLDFYQISKWENDPRRRFDTIKDLEIGERFLEVLRDTFQKARILYIEGNHEQRLWRYCWRNVPEFIGLPGLSMVNLLNLDNYGVEWVDGMKPILAGEHLYIIHGHEFGPGVLNSNPVNPARGLFLRAKTNAICGHFHQSSKHSEPSLAKPISCWSVGTLGTLHPQYRPINKWNHGFATVEMDRRMWSVDNKEIIDGEVV